MRLTHTIFLILASLGSHSQNIDVKKVNLSLPRISAINAYFPLYLNHINFHGSKSTLQLLGAKKARIERVIKEYYFNDCLGDSSETYFSIKDIYINTVQLRDSLLTIYLVLLKDIAGSLNSKILVFDNFKKKFLEQTIDFNIHAMYKLNNGKLKPTNLKEIFKIRWPDIELIDFDKDGTKDFKLTRLYHNGTFNAIETMMLKVNRNKIDTLDFKKQWIN